MSYTVKKLSELSGVSVRTLHFYEEFGLLKPAYYGSNGYRYYEEKELLVLQQILFFKELGFPLKQIRKVLGRSDFDQLAALHSHRKAISHDWERLEKLLGTIDKTIEHLTGEKKMKEEDIYGGFITKEKQKEYETYWKNRLGEDHPIIRECEENSKKWTKEDMDKAQKENDQNMKELVKWMAQNRPADSPEVHSIIRKHYAWIKKFWTPNRETYIGLGEGYTGFEWKKFFETYDPHHPKLAMYLAAGMKAFALRELS